MNQKPGVGFQCGFAYADDSQSWMECYDEENFHLGNGIDASILKISQPEHLWPK